MLPSMHGTTSFLEMEADYSAGGCDGSLWGKSDHMNKATCRCFINIALLRAFVPSSFSLASMPEQLYRPAPSPLAQSRCYACFSLSFLSSLPFCTHRISLPSSPPSVRLAAERQNIDHASGSFVVETETFRRSFLGLSP